MCVFFFQAEDGIRDIGVTGVQTCALPICDHCVKAVTQAIRQRDPRAQVKVDLANGLVRTETDLPRASVVAAVEEEGYTGSGERRVGEEGRFRGAAYH